MRSRIVVRDDIGPYQDIPAPDMYTTSQHMAWFKAKYESLVGQSAPGVVTGKPICVGGSEGRDEATARGNAYVLEEYLKRSFRSPEGLTVAIQGYGNAGAFSGEILENMGCKIVAISDSCGGILDWNGLNPFNVSRAKKEKGAVTESEQGQIISNEDLLTLPVDVLVLAAKENVITANNAALIQAKIITEPANGPITIEADNILKQKGIIVLPDILANAGGVAVSHQEWIQNNTGHYLSLEEIRNRLRYTMAKSAHEVFGLQQKYNCSMRSAAYILALSRLRDAIVASGALI